MLTFDIMKRLLFVCSAFLLLQSNAIAQCSCTSNSPINQDLVACYPFNGNANDQTSNANNPTSVNAALTTDRFGNANSAYYFDGIDDGIEIPKSSSIEPLNTISVCAWVYKESSSNAWTPIISKRYSIPDPYNSYSMDGGAGISQKWMVNICKGTVGSQNSVLTKNTRPYNVWDFLVLVYDGAKLKMFLNGDIEDSIALSGNIGYSSLGLFIGKNSVAGQFFKGKIDDVRIYNRALSPCDIKYLYNSCTGIVSQANDLIIPSKITACAGSSVQLASNYISMSYAWTPANLLNDATIANPTALINQNTTFYLTATNGFCTYTDSVLVEIQPFSINVKKQETICPGDSIRLTVSGANSYKWKYNLSLNDTTIARPYAKPSITQTYYVIGISNGCEALDSVTVTIENNLITSAGIDTTICWGDTIKLNANGGSVFNWSPFVTINDTMSSSPFVWPRSNQYYYLYAKSGTCFSYDTVLVSVNPLPTIALNDTIICGTSQSFTPSLLTANADTYKWQPSTYLSNSNIQTPIISPQQSITYFVEAHNSITGCNAIDTFSISVNNPKAQFTLTDTAVLIPSNILLNNTSLPLPLNFDWFLNDTFKSNNQQIDMMIDKIGINKIKLVVKDTNGCLDSVELLVNGKQPKNIFIPNVFTPNGDGVNDLFSIDTDISLFKELTGSIWNRWGGKLYEFDGKTGDWWNGEYENKPCAEGVYFYLLKTITIQGAIKEYRGTLTLIR